VSAAAPGIGSIDGRRPTGEPQTLAAPAGLISDVVAITGRAIRGILREPELFIFALIIPVFFFVVQIGALGKVVGNLFGEMFAVLGYSLVLLVFGFLIGVRFDSPVVGPVGLLALTLLFGIGFAAVSIAVALATGSVRATQSTFIIFFPLLFLTPSALPRDLMTGWFEKAVSINPMTYVIEAARSFLFGFDGAVVGKGFLAAALFSALTFGLTALAFRRRVRMG
jgi:ABC-2 type transport system permease protein